MYAIVNLTCYFSDNNALSYFPGYGWIEVERTNDSFTTEQE